jgi:hypothetical protein
MAGNLLLKKGSAKVLSFNSLEYFVVKIRHIAKAQPLCVILQTCSNLKMNYNDKIFRPISNSENGETSEDTIFHYKQTGQILTCEYSGGQIMKGHLIGLVDENGFIKMAYHQINNKLQIMTGTCDSKPEILEDGKIRLHEIWQWTSGDKSIGQSILEEV